MSDSILTKICPRCKVEKPASEFHKRKRNKDGLNEYCKDCVFIYQKKYRAENAELIKVRQSNFYKANSDKIKKKSNDYYKSNTEKCNKRNRLYYEKNIEKIRVLSKVYRDNHIEEKKIQDKNYRENNSKKIKAKKKEYYKANAEEINLKTKAYRETHINEFKLREKIYRDNNKEKAVEYNKYYRKTEVGKAAIKKAQSKRRAAKSGATVEDFSPTEVFERDGYRCQICNRKTRPDFKNQFHPLYPNLDHIIPLSKGGEHSKKNTQCLCRSCNATKHNSEDFGDQLRLFG